MCHAWHCINCLLVLNVLLFDDGSLFYQFFTLFNYLHVWFILFISTELLEFFFCSKFKQIFEIFFYIYPLIFLREKSHYTMKIVKNIILLVQLNIFVNSVLIWKGESNDHQVISSLFDFLAKLHYIVGHWFSDGSTIYFIFQTFYNLFNFTNRNDTWWK